MRRHRGRDEPGGIAEQHDDALAELGRDPNQVKITPAVYCVVGETKTISVARGHSGNLYADIQNELRAQYILGFYLPNGVKPGSKWHEVSVQVGEGRAKTIRGYYP